MPKLAVRIPTYRLHKPSGRALVTIDGRDVYLGKHGTPESEAEYHRVIAEWQTNHHQRAAAGQASAGPTMDEIILAYTEHARTYYRKPDGRPTSEVNTLAQALRPLHECSLRLRSIDPLTLEGAIDRLHRPAIAVIRHRLRERRAIEAVRAARADYRARCGDG